MSERMKLPEVSHYQRFLSDDNMHRWNSYSYGEQTNALLDELFELVHSITPKKKRNIRELWLRAERGTPDDYGDVNELIENGEYESAEEFYNEWKWRFPDETGWFHFSSLEDDDGKYRAIFLGHRVVISQTQFKDAEEYRCDISGFVQWMIDAVKECISMLKDGTYNEFVRKNLPPEHRTGTIVRKNFWDAFPEAREDFFKDISKEDVLEFCDLAYAQGDKTNLTFLKEMTANDFFGFCAMGYAANNYNGCEKTSKEQYYLHADGRDEGLGKIDPDSPREFHEWLTDKSRVGGHPWEVCRGGNSTHVALYVGYDEKKGYYLILSGDAWNRTVETVKFYLALHRAGLPVYLNKAGLLADRMLEKEKIGIVPDGVIPAYCESWFPGEAIIDFMNFPYEEMDKILPFCDWQEIPEVTLIDTSEESQ